MDWTDIAKAPGAAIVDLWIAFALSWIVASLGRIGPKKALAPLRKRPIA